MTVHNKIYMVIMQLSTIRYHFNKLRIVHSLKVLLMILPTVKQSFIRDCPGSLT